MSWLAIGGAMLLSGLLWWFFFGPKRAGQVVLEDGVQVMRVQVGGCSRRAASPFPGWCCPHRAAAPTSR